jgi:protein SOK2
MINGTKLLNVAGMTRGRRDGILKSEKTRHVVKIGPMHLKGVWIPFDRALDFANKEKITEQLYPLFVHDIGALLYHPSNQPRPGMGNSSALAAVDRRRSDTRYMAGPPTSQAPPLHHHHSMSTPMASQPPHSIAPHPSTGRPELGRAHTFPTPPTSASSNFGVSGHGSSYEWQGSQPLSIDTSLARSVPTTPASTPPGSTIPGMPYGTSQAYDGGRQVYTAPPTQAQYPSQLRQFGGALQSSVFPKSEMAPPPRTGEAEQPSDVKPSHEGIAQSAPGPEEAEHEQESEYTHTSAPYNPNRASYSYNPNPSGVSRVPEDLTASPHQNGSGRATPRTTEWQAGYAPQPNQAPASNVYSVMEPRSTNGDSYSYPSSYVNGNVPSSKRGREDDEEVDDGLKRQKTLHDTPEGGPVGGSPYSAAANRPRATASSRRR